MEIQSTALLGGHGLLKKSYFKMAFLMFIYTTISQTLYLTPIMPIYVSYIQPTYIVIYGLFFVLYIGDIFFRNRAITSFEFLTLYLLLIPFYLAWPATYLWDQPYYYGVAASREWFLAVSPIFIFYLFKTKRVSLKEIFVAMLILAWTYLIIYVAVTLISNPNQFGAAHPPVYISCNNAKGGCSYRFDMLPLIFASIFYFIRFVKKNDWIAFGCFLLFAAYIVFIEKKRSMMLALAGTLVLFFVFSLSPKKIVFYSLTIFGLLIVGVGGLYLVKPDAVAAFINMFANAFAVLGGNKVSEGSADVRIIETMEALAIIAVKPISLFIGNGRISDKFNGGQYGGFPKFYPSDIDIIGAIFQYGIIGYLLVQVEYLYVIILSFKVRKYSKNFYYKTCIFVLIFYMGDGGASNCFTIGIATVPLFIMLMYCFYYAQKYPDRGYVIP